MSASGAVRDVAPAAPRSRLARARDYLAMRPVRGQLPELDGLRGLAILLVLVRHAVRPFHQPGAPLLPVAGWDAATPLLNGWAGVDLFFVLSGFLITGHILSRPGGAGGEMGTYLASRALRIVPAYAAVLLVVAAGLVPFYPLVTEGLGFRVAYHLLFLQDYLATDIVVTLWSLGVEEKFYLLAPGLLLLLGRVERPAARYAAVGALAAVPLALRWLTHLGNPDMGSYEEFFRTFRSPFHVAADGLLVGVLCALVYRDRARYAWTRDTRVTGALFWGGALLVGALLLPAVRLDRIDPFDRTLLFSLLAVGFGAVLLALALGAGAVARPFRARWLFVLARLSYSLYLVHMLVIPGVRTALGEWAQFRELSPSARFLVFLPLFVATSLAAALALHYGVEKPFLLLKARLGTSVARPRRESFVLAIGRGVRRAMSARA